MINFFRTERLRFISSNRFSKYVFYAIGEIVLVVIGILIALQVNNWNENQKDKKLERSVLLNLKSEFQDNIQNLQSSISKRNHQMEAINTLFGWLNSEPIQFNSTSFDSLVGLSRYVSNFEARSGVIEEIINSGKLNLLHNKELRKILSNWSGDIDDLRRKEDGLQDIILLQYNPYLTKNYTLRNSDNIIVQELWKNNENLDKSWRMYQTSSNTKINGEELLRDPEFESLLSLINLWDISGQITSNELKAKMERTLGIIESDLNN